MLLLSCLLVFATFPLAAHAKKETDKKDNKTEANSNQGKFASKDEVIYGKLDANGNTKNMYVVNSFSLTEPSSIIDYGTYRSVSNLTDLTDIELVDDSQVHFNAEEEFYYQGELESHKLPWDFSITYLLDGKEMKPEELPGVSGNLEIHIETKANKEIDSVFFDYYLLQISLKLDPLIFRNIQAPKGSEANEGKNKMIAFSVMPGQEDLLIVSSRVSDLKMDPIEIVAIPANIAIENPDTDDLTGDIKMLSDAIHDINDAVGELKQGVSSLRSGATELSNGSTAYQNGIKEISQSSSGLVGGSKEILGGLQQINTALNNSSETPDFSELAELPSGLNEMAAGLKGLSEVLGALQGAIDQIPSPTITEEEIGAIYALLNENEADERMVEVLTELNTTYQAAQAVKQINQMFPDNVTAVINSIASNLEATAKGLGEALANLDQLDDLAELQKGIKTLATEYQTFHNGLVSYTGGVNTLATSYQNINAGTKSVTTGISELETGVSKLHEGTQELEEETNDLPDQIESEIDKFMEEFDYSNYEPTSFVSSKNKNISVVQFVLQTERIEMDEQEELPEKTEVKKNMWNRFLDLFS